MSLSERKKRELQALADAAGDALDDLVQYNEGRRREMKPALRSAKPKKKQ